MGADGIASTVRAGGRVPLPREQTWRLLADLDRHHALIDSGMTILALDGPRGARTGGLVELRGPLGLRRRAQTKVEAAKHPRWLAGTAATPSGTRASLEWYLRASPHGTRVDVELQITPATRRDRLLLALGARPWLRRRLRAAVDRLGAIASSRAVDGLHGHVGLLTGGPPRPPDAEEVRVGAADQNGVADAPLALGRAVLVALEPAGQPQRGRPA